MNSSNLAKYILLIWPIVSISLDIRLPVVYNICNSDVNILLKRHKNSENNMEIIVPAADAVIWII